MPKSPQKQQKSTDEENYLCNLCSKIAYFECGNCSKIHYCSKQHQKADWGLHRKDCTSQNQKIKKHLIDRTALRKQVVFLYSKGDFGLATHAVTAVDKLVNMQRQFLRQIPNVNNQIQYAASVFLQIRILLATKNHNMAQDHLTNYYNQKINFIEDLSQIPEKLNTNNNFYESERKFVLAKLRLISTLANLTHRIMRISFNIVEILIKHISKFYGPQSIELSNCYFQTGMYYNHMKQKNKAIACFLKSAKLRKNKGASAYYNAALLFIQTNQLSKAILFLQVALKLLEQSNLVQNIEFKAYIYENIGICYAKLNQSYQCIKSLEYALYLLKPKGQSIIHPHYIQIINFLRELKRMLNENEKDGYYVPLELPHENLNLVKKPILLSSKNLQLFWNNNEEQTKHFKYQRWRDTFYNLRQRIKLTKIGVEAPQFVSKYIWANNNKEEELLSNKKQQIEKVNVRDRIVISQALMQELTALQVDYLQSLDVSIAECKDQFLIFQIVDNSNFIGSITPQQLELFFKLNPSLVKGNFSENKKLSRPNKGQKNIKAQPQLQSHPPKIITPKLKLQKIQK